MKRKRTIYIEEDVDELIHVEDDKFYGEYAEEAFRLFLDRCPMTAITDVNGLCLFLLIYFHCTIDLNNPLFCDIKIF